MIYKNKTYEHLTEEDKEEWVLDQACDAYAKGKITLERLEEDIENILQGRTPVYSDGMPIYYDPRILDRVNY